MTTHRAGRGLSAPRIVFLVVAAAAPMAALVGLVPLQYALGNGAGAPGAFVIAGLVLLCFGVGYAAMARRITNTGGFYTFICRGLGRAPGVAAACVALIAYTAVGLQLAAGFGYFMQITFAQAGVSVPWEVFTALGVAASGFLSYRRVDLSAKVLGTLMACEIGVLLILDFAVLGHRGTGALPLTSFEPDTVFTSGLAVSLLVAFGSFIGFESAALYGEESRDPKRTIPVATYWALGVITVFYGITSWIGVGAVGADRVHSVAGKELGNYFFALDDQYVNSTMTSIMAVLLCTSIFASLLAIQNAASRYIYALGRERILPGWFGQAHTTHESPARATLVITALNAVVPGIFAVAGLDPYLNLATSMAGLGTIGIIVLQAAAAAAVIGFFRRHPDRHWWRTLLAPAIGLAGLVYAGVLVVGHFSLLTGTTSAIVNDLPWLVLAAAVLGLGYARWLKANKPAVYGALAADEHTSPTSESPYPESGPTLIAGSPTS